MKPDIKEIIWNAYVRGYINGDGQKVMPTIDDPIYEYNAASSTSYQPSGQDKWKQKKINP